jgi:hypothetical protein
MTMAWPILRELAEQRQFAFIAESSTRHQRRGARQLARAARQHARLVARAERANRRARPAAAPHADD